MPLYAIRPTCVRLPSLVLSFSTRLSLSLVLSFLSVRLELTTLPPLLLLLLLLLLLTPLLLLPLQPLLLLLPPLFLQLHTSGSTPFRNR